jgi:hypothetical protein
MLKRMNKFINYLLEKKSEIRDLDKKDALLAKTVLDIHRKRTHSDFVIVPLFSIKQIHAIDRDNAITNTEKRINALQNGKDFLLQKKEITRAVLAEYLPSVSWIKVVRESDDCFISYEGNGRLVALQKVFTPADGISLEVEEYYFKDSHRILRDMNRVRKLNGLRG